MYNSFNINYFNDDKANRLYNPNSTICGIPHVFLYYYVSKKYHEWYSFTQEVTTFREKIWGFKNGSGIDQEWAINAVTEVLEIGNYNGKYNPKLTFVCIPASTIDLSLFRPRSVIDYVYKTVLTISISLRKKPQNTYMVLSQKPNLRLILLSLMVKTLSYSTIS